MNWFVLALGTGTDIDLAIHVDPLPSARPRRQNGAGYTLTNVHILAVLLVRIGDTLGGVEAISL
jgi:hypothetical protein